MSEESYSTQRLDHLGIVAGICQQIGLVEGDFCISPRKGIFQRHTLSTILGLTL